MDLYELRSFQMWLEEKAASEDPLFFTLHHLESKQRIGRVSFLNIVSDMQRLELGHFWYSPDAQRSSVKAALGGLESVGYDGWVSVELDRPYPPRPAAEAAVVNREYLRSLGY